MLYSKYGFEKLSPDEVIVTHCNNGGRATKGMNVFKEIGFKNVQVYSGLTDWKGNGGDIEKFENK